MMRVHLTGSRPVETPAGPVQSTRLFSEKKRLHFGRPARRAGALATRYAPREATPGGAAQAGIRHLKLTAELNGRSQRPDRSCAVGDPSALRLPSPGPLARLLSHGPDRVAKFEVLARKRLALLRYLAQ